MSANQKKPWTMNRITLAIGIPLALVFLYFAFTSKPKPVVLPPRVTEFRIGGQKEDKTAKKWTVDLIWTTEHAEKVTIDPLVGKVDANGTVAVTLDKSGTFVLTAVNEAGKAEFSLEIELPAAK